MKAEKRKEARRLRHSGMSVKEITDKLGVAKSSVSLWVRDIELSEEQRLALKRRNPIYMGQHKGSKVVAEKHRGYRRQYQEEGRQKAREAKPLHLAGCMLYWAEGAKSRHSFKLVNSDPDMLIYYMHFLRYSLGVDDNDITVRVNCYLGNGLTLADIENFWLNTLTLDHHSLRKGRCNNQPKSSKQKGRKLIYGVCEIAVNNTQLLHHVYGAIQEYAGIEKPEWLG